MAAKRVQKTNHSPTERFSVSVCGNPLNRQPLLLSCPLISVEPRVISPCGHQRVDTSRKRKVRTVSKKIVLRSQNYIDFCVFLWYNVIRNISAFTLAVRPDCLTTLTIIENGTFKNRRFAYVCLYRCLHRKGGYQFEILRPRAVHAS